MGRWVVTTGDSYLRCTLCGHPASEGTWEHEVKWTRRMLLIRAEHELREYGNTECIDRLGVTYYSPCDEGCDHSGPGRVQPSDQAGMGSVCGWNLYLNVCDAPVTLSTGCGWVSTTVEASWRHVDIRASTGTALCLRCYVEQTKGVVSCT